MTDNSETTEADKALDRARAEEALRLTLKRLNLVQDGMWLEALAKVWAEEASRLAREGWKPEDPLLKEAREIVVRDYSLTERMKEEYSSGSQDGDITIISTLNALRRGIEIERERVK